MNVAIDISGTVLHTQRLTLRPWRQEDLLDFYEYASVDGVGQMTGWLPHASMEESRMILDMFIREKKTFAIVHEGKVIGSLGVEEYEEDKLPEFAEKRGRELGFVLAKPYWGQGLMPEAVHAATDWLFRKEQLDFVLVGHFDWNGQSKRVVEKSGFRYIKTNKFETRYGTVENALEYILYNPERSK